MAKIPVGNFGNAVAPLATQRRQLPLSELVDTSLGDIGAGLGKVATSMMAEEELQKRQRAAEEKAQQKTAASLLWIEHENSVLGAAAETVGKLKTGELRRDDARPYFTKLVDDSASAALSGIAPDLQGPTEMKFKSVANRVSRTVQAAIDDNRRGEIAGNLESIRDGMLKQASIPGAQLGSLLTGFEETAQALGPQAGMDPAKLGKTVQDFKDAATFAHYKQRMIEGSGSIKSLQAIETEIKTHPGLDSDKRLALMSSTQSQIVGLQQRAEIEVKRRERSSAKAWQSAVDVVQAGKPLSPEFAATLAQTLKGTPYAKALSQLLTQAPQNLAFAAQPVRQQETALLSLQAKGNTAGWTPEEQKQYEKLNRVHEATLNDIKADPWKAGLERGVLAQVAPLTVGDLRTLPAAMAERTRQADTLAIWAGRDVSPLRPEEARQVAGLLDALPVSVRVEMLGGIAKTMKPGQMQAFSAQIGDKLGIAGLLAGRDLRTDKGRTAAELYLKGIEAMREKRLTFDEAKQSRVREDIRREIEGAYLTESGTNTAMESAFGVYAGLKSEGNGGNVKQAVAIATGGIMTYNGGKISKPYGWSDNQVKDAVRAVTPERVRSLFGEEVAIGGEKLGADAFAKALSGARLGPSPMPGAYSIIIGGRLATGLDGRALVLPLEAR